jgi:L-ascorbate metabolism protein UlaG (beta-lactamase superfamily)
MGDTGLFADMKFIADYYKPDLVLIPIGGHFTMDPADAAYALRELIKPKFAIPMHYNTNPFNRGTPEEMIKALGNAPVKVFALKPGDKAEF